LHAGLLDLVTSSYLITITQREQVASIRGRPIFTVRAVTLIPLSSQAEAERAITAAQKTAKQGDTTAEQTEESDVGEDAGTGSVGEGEDEPPPEAKALEPPKESVLKKSSSFVKEVVQDKGKYGRFAERWFSKGGWKINGKRRQGMSSEQDVPAEERLNEEQKREVAVDTFKEGEGAVDPSGEVEAGTTEDEDGKENAKPEPETKTKTTAKRKSVIETLTPRILRAARLYFSSSGFFFSYEHDISGTLMQRDVQTSSLPLWKRFSPDCFWNHHLMRPFIDAGQDAFILPLLQGFVGQRAFSIARTDGTEPDVVADAAQKTEDVVAVQDQIDASSTTEKKDGQEDFLLTLISRRSTARAGLRYLRRGVDDEGNVANYVETEQILSPQSWDMFAKTFSLLQVRGSIPLFFSQSPYSFKPLPVLFGSEATNHAALRRHFEKVTKRYGNVHAASLVDKHGTEVSIGEAYERHAKLLNEEGGVNGGKKIGFEWFDFHSVCKGMRFDKVTVLLETLESPLRSFGWTVKQDDRNIRQQTGVLRTNCMDCLDRTNVVQSAVGGWALQEQLKEMGLRIDLQHDARTQWFNTLW
jgi:hypothetical protein